MGMRVNLANITEPSEFLYEAETAESSLVIVADDARHDSVNSGRSPSLSLNKHHSTQLKWVRTSSRPRYNQMQLVQSLRVI